MLLAGFIAPTYGDILIAEKSVAAVPSYRRDLGIVSYAVSASHGTPKLRISAGTAWHAGSQALTTGRPERVHLKS